MGVLARATDRLGRLAAVALLLLPGAAAAQSAGFAHKYSVSEVLGDSLRRQQFVADYLRSEARFLQAGVAWDSAPGLALDGSGIDYFSGRPYGLPRCFTTPSKLALAMTLDALALAGAPQARILVASDDTTQATLRARDRLARQVTALEAWSAAYPAFAGFVPWVDVIGGAITPPAAKEQRR
jgi:hypothetical protein